MLQGPGWYRDLVGTGTWLVERHGRHRSLGGAKGSLHAISLTTRRDHHRFQPNLVGRSFTRSRPVAASIRVVAHPLNGKLKLGARQSQRIDAHNMTALMKFYCDLSLVGNENHRPTWYWVRPVLNLPTYDVSFYLGLGNRPSSSSLWFHHDWHWQ